MLCSYCSRWTAGARRGGFLQFYREIPHNANVASFYYTDSYFGGTAQMLGGFDYNQDGHDDILIGQPGYDTAVVNAHCRKGRARCKRQKTY